MSRGSKRTKRPTGDTRQDVSEPPSTRDTDSPLARSASRPTRARVYGSAVLARRRRPERDAAAPTPIYGDLRERALRADPADIGLHPTPEVPRVYGALMETAYPSGTATVVSFCDGTTSLYTSTGGGVIGGGEHASVAAATRAFIEAADQFRAEMEPTTTFPPPTVGSVRFQILTFTGGLTVEAEEQALGENRHRLSPLFYAGHEVITQLRLIDETRSRV